MVAKAEVARGTAKTVMATVMVRVGVTRVAERASGAPAARKVKGGGREGGGEGAVRPARWRRSR